MMTAVWKLRTLGQFSSLKSLLPRTGVRLHQVRDADQQIDNITRNKQGKYQDDMVLG
jgi:uncharacterized NAD-dependent epimerase/dehydratase family protein